MRFDSVGEKGKWEGEGVLIKDVLVLVSPFSEIRQHYVKIGYGNRIKLTAMSCEVSAPDDVNCGIAPEDVNFDINRSAKCSDPRPAFPITPGERQPRLTMIPFVGVGDWIRRISTLAVAG